MRSKIEKVKLLTAHSLRIKMTIGFILIRIDEQLSYISKITQSNLDEKRKVEILESALGQLNYFRDKLNSIKKETKHD
jgi:hypothetical protein